MLCHLFPFGANLLHSVDMASITFRSLSYPLEGNLLQRFCILINGMLVINTPSFL